MNIFVENMSHAAAGLLTKNETSWEIACVGGQGDPSRVFSSAGHEVYRKTGDKLLAERCMYALAIIATMISRTEQAKNIDKMADLLCYFVERFKHMEYDK